MKKLENLSIADLKAIVQILEEKHAVYVATSNGKRAEIIHLEKQEIEDYLDKRLEALDIYI